MTFEVSILAWSVLLTVVQFALMAAALKRDVGPRWMGGSRDELRQFGPMAGRMKRAFDNQLEGLLLFAAAVVVVTLSGHSTAFTQWMATFYLAARIAYVPAYAFPVWGLRSAVWSVGFFATVAMVVSALVFATPL